MSDVERPDDRADFRLLARALAGDCELTDEEWRSSRRSLIRTLRVRG